MSLAELPTAGRDTATQPDTGTRPAGGSLKPVLDVVPPEAYERSTARGLFLVARDWTFYMGAVAGLALTDHPVLTPLLWVVAGLSIFALFMSSHDMCHLALFDSRRLNTILGRISFLPTLHPFAAWEIGHNRIHHNHTVREARDPVWAPLSADDYRALSAPQRALHRIEWSWAGCGLYYVRNVLWGLNTAPAPTEKTKGPVRSDRLLVLAWIVATMGGAAALGAVAHGSVAGALWSVVDLWIIPFAIFAYLLGWVVHVHHIHPDITWWGAGWDKFHGQVEGTTILWAPRGFDLFFHWITIHVPHHVDVRIPMYHLPLAARAISAAFPDRITERKLTVRSFLHSARACKLYDFENHRWLTYDEALRPVATPASSPATV